MGGAVRLQGHGSRDRQVRGPATPDGPPTHLVVTARRYRCVPCGAVLLVVPREVVGRRVYSASAIALALALWGLMGQTAARVRQRVSGATVVGHDAITGWASLRRWARAIAKGQLFASVRPMAVDASHRMVARQTAAALAADTPPATRLLSLEHRAFLGAAQAA